MKFLVFTEDIIVEVKISVIGNTGLHLRKAARAVRQGVMALNTHLGSSLSCVEILTALYYGGVMRFFPSHPSAPTRDRFILSKGHAGPALYVVLSSLGYFDSIGGENILRSMGKCGALLGKHPDNPTIPGVDFISGTLGEGLGVAVGMACGLREQNNPAKVFVLLGDGECSLGNIWEAAGAIIEQGLVNIIPIVDVNGFSYSSTVNRSRLRQRWGGFGFRVIECSGHSISSLVRSLQRAKQAAFPTVILAKTQKGKGTCLAGRLESHGMSLPEASRPPLDSSSLRQMARNNPTRLIDDMHEGASPLIIPELAVPRVPTATRQLGKMLTAYVNHNPQLHVLCPDVGQSTLFDSRLPTTNLGLRESLTVAAAAGLSAVGEIPVVSIFDAFLMGTLRELLHCFSLARLPGIILASHSGVGVGQDGPTHHSVLTPLYMRAMPGVVYMEPADIVQAKMLFDYALRHFNALYYLRLSRQDLPVITLPADTDIELGAQFVGGGTDTYSLTVVAAGAMVHHAIQVQAELGRCGVVARVVNMFSPTFFERLPASTQSRFIDSSKPVFTAIDGHHGVLSAFANAAGESFGVSNSTCGGDAHALYEMHGLSVEKLTAIIGLKCGIDKG